MVTDMPSAPTVDEALLTAYLERIAAAFPGSEATRETLAPAVIPSTADFSNA